MRYRAAIFILLTCCSRQVKQETKASDSIEVAVPQVVSTPAVVPQAPPHAVLDSLRSFIRTNGELSRDFHAMIFDHEPLESDAAYIRTLARPCNNLNSVVAVHHSVECDSRYTYIALFLFDDNWHRKGALSLESSSGVDMFYRTYDVINDSTYVIHDEKGFDYDTDDHVKTVARIRINEAKLFDTLSIEIDTVRSTR